MLALSYKKVIIIPDISLFTELSGPGIYKFDSPDELQKQIQSMSKKVSQI